jgi:hypothetical protein
VEEFKLCWSLGLVVPGVVVLGGIRFGSLRFDEFSGAIQLVYSRYDFSISCILSIAVCY